MNPDRAHPQALATPPFHHGTDHVPNTGRVVFPDRCSHVTPAQLAALSAPRSPMPLTRILTDRHDVGHRAVALVLEAATAPGLSGGQRRRRVVAQLAEEFDARTTFGAGPVGRMLELVDGTAYRVGLTLLVEGIVLGVEAGRAAVRG